MDFILFRVKECSLLGYFTNCTLVQEHWPRCLEDSRQSLQVRPASRHIGISASPLITTCCFPKGFADYPIWKAPPSTGAGPQSRALLPLELTGKVGPQAAPDPLNRIGVSTGSRVSGVCFEFEKITPGVASAPGLISAGCQASIQGSLKPQEFLV